MSLFNLKYLSFEFKNFYRNNFRVELAQFNFMQKFYRSTAGTCLRSDFCYVLFGEACCYPTVQKAEM